MLAQVPTWCGTSERSIAHSESRLTVYRVLTVPAPPAPDEAHSGRRQYSKMANRRLTDSDTLIALML